VDRSEAGTTLTVKLHGASNEIEVASPTAQLDLAPSSDLLDVVVAHDSVTPR